jgi:hypothetical protein
MWYDSPSTVSTIRGISGMSGTRGLIQAPAKLNAIANALAPTIIPRVDRIHLNTGAS